METRMTEQQGLHQNSKSSGNYDKIEENMTSSLVHLEHSGILTSESLVEDVIGCGPFQVMIVLLVTILTKVPTAATFMFMSFGNYNPGWRCLDNSTGSGDTINNTSIDFTVNVNVTEDSEPEYLSGTCDEFDACNNIEFNPESSTIVTEWGLLCNRSWIMTLIIAIQMFGALIGSIIAGQLGDSFGRKTIVYGCIATIGVLNVVSMFSSTWQMFAVMRFFIGAAVSSLLAVYYVLTNECLPYKWRGPNNAIPAWNIGTILFAVLAYIFRDWKILHMCIAVMAAVCFIPVIFVPESLRWLAVKQKNEEYIKVVTKMARMNKKELPPVENLNEIIYNSSEEKTGSKNYTVIHLLHPGYKLQTIIISFVWMTFSLIYYAISFGVKNLSGNFYFNLILLFALAMPFAIFPSFVPNLIGRVKGSILFVFFSILCILACAGCQIWGNTTEKIAGSIIILFAKVFLNSGWCIHIMHTTELYPTVVRGLGLGWGCLMARVGGIIASFVIPNDKNVLYISYIAMAILSVLLCGGIIQLPETKGRPLRDSLDEKEEEEDEEASGVGENEKDIINGTIEKTML